jgi:hypothetical protein
MNINGVHTALPKRIVLSRKGFDQAAGGCPSPILPGGRLFSIPIPESEGHTAHAQFEDLGSQNELPLPRSLGSSVGRTIPLTGPVHLDPDIRPSLRPAFASKHCASTYPYGQDNASQTHLDNEGVGPGDLFLYFGLFREAQRHGDHVRFERSATMKHVIWGWLQVGTKHHLNGAGLPDELRWAGHHPHIDYPHRVNNCMYVGAPSLSFAPDLPGAGIFDTLRDELRLTAPNEYRCSFWALPRFLSRCGMTFHDLTAWNQDGERIFGRSVGRGQEFVIKTAGVEKEAAAWLGSIFDVGGRMGKA